MNLDDLSPELKEKALACKSPQEILELAKSEGYELSDETLETISGGSWEDWSQCEEKHYTTDPSMYNC